MGLRNFSYKTRLGNQQRVKSRVPRGIAEEHAEMAEKPVFSSLPPPPRTLFHHEPEIFMKTRYISKTSRPWSPVVTALSLVTRIGLSRNNSDKQNNLSKSRDGLAPSWRVCEC